MDLCATQQGLVKVRNKPERLQEFRSTLSEVELANEFSPALAARAHGRQNHADR